MNINFNWNDTEYCIKIWDESVGKIGRFVSLDCETTMVPFYMTPELVTCQVYSGGKNVYYVPKEKIKSFLDIHSSCFLLGTNIPFDMDVLAKYLQDTSFMYRFYDNNLVHDIGILWRLYHLAEFGFIPFKRSLAHVTQKLVGVELIKDETRENFSQFLSSKISDIPSNYLEYGAIDVIATYLNYFRLKGLIRNHDKYDT